MPYSNDHTDRRPGARERRGRLGLCVRVLPAGVSLVLGAFVSAAPALAVDRDTAANRFWRDAEDILGARLGYSAQHGHYGPSVRFEIGVVELSAGDEKRLRDALPGPWAKLDTFTTKYSLEELRDFGLRAEAALEEAGLARFWGGFSAAALDQPDLVTVYLVDEHPLADRVLRDELPDDAFETQVDGGVQTLPGPGEPEHGGGPWIALLGVTAAAVSGGVVLLRARRRPAAVS